MKKILFFLLATAFLPIQLYAGKYYLSIKRTPAPIPVKSFETSDNTWEIPVLNINSQPDRKSKYVVIDGIPEGTPANQKVTLRGFAFSREEMIISLKDKVVLSNIENFDRELRVVKDGNVVEDSIVVKKGSLLPYAFTSAGTYTIEDKKYKWSNLTVSVFSNKRVIKIGKKGLSAQITIPSGSYVLRIYDGLNVLYKEDFSIVGESSLRASYTYTGSSFKRNDSIINAGRYDIVAP